MINSGRWIIFIVVILGSNQLACTGNIEKKKTTEIITISPGESLYKQYCQSCHKPDGSGVPDLYPALNGKKIKGDKDTLIRIVLLDIEREAIVREGKFEQEMPGQNYLTNHEIAFITSYIREEFGGVSDPVSQEEVANVRNGLK